MTMTDAKVKLLEKAVSWVSGGDAYAIAKGIVDNLMDTEMSGAEKLQKAKDILYPVLSKVAPFVINMLIEVAVFALKSQMGVKK